MSKYNIPYDIITWIQNFLSSIVLTMEIKQGMIEKKMVKGLLQGSVLSPILFNLYTKSLHDLFAKKSEVELVQYADDFALIIKHKNEKN